MMIVVIITPSPDCHMHPLDLGFFYLIEEYKIKNRIIAPEMLSSEILAATAKLTEAEADLC